VESAQLSEARSVECALAVGCSTLAHHLAVTVFLLEPAQHTAATTMQLVMSLSLVAVDMHTTRHTAHSMHHHAVSMTLLLMLLM
jgi:hypothetical protein